MELSAEGVLERFGVELIGADAEAIRRAEDREAFRGTMAVAGLPVPASRVVGDVAAGRAAAAELGLPVILRPGFTLGGEGEGPARPSWRSGCRSRSTPARSGRPWWSARCSGGPRSSSR